VLRFVGLVTGLLCSCNHLLGPITCAVGCTRMLSSVEEKMDELNYSTTLYIYSTVGMVSYVLVYSNLNQPPCLLYRGPEGTPFEGGVFTTRLVFPPDYPLSPPKMRFVGDMFHPNGKFC